jgi:cytochrome oxidase assembly protein ShyY1
MREIQNFTAVLTVADVASIALLLNLSGWQIMRLLGRKELAGKREVRSKISNLSIESSIPSARSRCLPAAITCGFTRHGASVAGFFEDFAN